LFGSLNLGLVGGEGELLWSRVQIKVGWAVLQTMLRRWVRAEQCRHISVATACAAMSVVPPMPATFHRSPDSHNQMLNFNSQNTMPILDAISLRFAQTLRVSHSRVSKMQSTASLLSRQRLWSVVVSKGDRSLLAQMSPARWAIMRRLSRRSMMWWRWPVAASR